MSKIGTASTSDRFLRHLGLAERLFQLYGERSNVNFSLIAEVEGPLDADAIGSAFPQVVGRHLLLSTEVGPGPTGHLAFFSDGPIPQVEVHRAARTEWPGFAARDVARRLGGDGAPFFHATVLLEEDAAAIILTFHHAVANGLSAVTVLVDLLSALAGKTLSPTALPASLEGYAGYEDALSDFRRPVQRSATASGNGSKQALADPRIAKLSIGRAETDALLAVSRAHGATLHGTLCTALAVVRARQTSKSETRIFSAVDLRETVGASDDACAFLNGAVLTPVAADQEFWETARSISAAATAYREPATVREVLQGMAAALPAEATPDVATAILEGPLGADVEVTNLGALTVRPSFGDLKVTDVWGPIPFPKTEGAPIVGIVGLGGALRITQTYRGDTGELLDDLHAFLRTTVLASSPL